MAELPVGSGLHYVPFVAQSKNTYREMIFKYCLGKKRQVVGQFTADCCKVDKRHDIFICVVINTPRDLGIKISGISVSFMRRKAFP